MEQKISKAKKEFKCEKCGKVYASTSGIWKHRKANKCEESTKEEVKTTRDKSRVIKPLQGETTHENDKEKIDDRIPIYVPKTKEDPKEEPKEEPKMIAKDTIIINGATINKWNPDELIDKYKGKKKDCQIVLIYGQKGSGKSTLLFSIVKKILPEIDRTYVFTGNIDNKLKFMSELKINEKQCLGTFDDPNTSKFIQKLIDFQEKTHGSKQKQILLLFDDVLDSSNALHGSNLLGGLFANHRHYGISIFLTTQQVTGISPRMRQNCNFAMILHSKCESVKKLIYNDYLSCIKKDEFDVLFTNATQDHSALVINSLEDKDYISVYNSRANW